MTASVNQHPTVKTPDIQFHSAGGRSIKNEKPPKLADKNVQWDRSSNVQINNNSHLIEEHDALINFKQLQNYNINNGLSKDDPHMLRFLNDSLDNNKSLNPEKDTMSSHSSGTTSVFQGHFTNNFVETIIPDTDSISADLSPKIPPTELTSLSDTDAESVSSYSKIPPTELTSRCENASEIAESFTESEIYELNNLIEDYKNISTLDKGHQTEVLARGKNLLDGLKTKKLSTDSEKTVVEAQKGLEILNNSVSLSQKGKFRISHMLLATTALGSCISSLMLLIINLVKNNSNIVADPAEAIEDNEQAIQEAKINTDNSQQELKELIETVGNKTDDEIANDAKANSLVESMEQGKFVVSRNDDGTIGDPQPSQEAKEVAEKAAEEALSEHYNNKNKLTDLQAKHQEKTTQLNELYKERESLLIKQETYKNSAKGSERNAINWLGGIGLLGMSGAVTAAGLNFMNNSKRLYRKNQVNKDAVAFTTNLVKNLKNPNAKLNEENKDKESPPPSYRTTETASISSSNNKVHNEFNATEMESLLSRSGSSKIDESAASTTASVSTYPKGRSRG